MYDCLMSFETKYSKLSKSVENSRLISERLTIERDALRMENRRILFERDRLISMHFRKVFFILS
jgi:hypothetical protein